MKYTLFRVFRGSPTVYKLIDEEDGETIFGRFYEWELQKIENPPELKSKEPVRGPMDSYVLRGHESAR